MVRRRCVVAHDEDFVLPSPSNGDQAAGVGLVSPMEAHASYRGSDWSPERLAFHQNLESFADRVGLIVGLQSNGKLSQEEAFAQIRMLWETLRSSKKTLLNDGDSPDEITNS
jgi:hypothetical protein